MIAWVTHGIIAVTFATCEIIEITHTHRGTIVVALQFSQSLQLLLASRNLTVVFRDLRDHPDCFCKSEHPCDCALTYSWVIAMAYANRGLIAVAFPSCKIISIAFRESWYPWEELGGSLMQSSSDKARCCPGNSRGFSEVLDGGQGLRQPWKRDLINL